jgi:aminoglycoside 2'-N-acetyltransferase I
VHGQCPHRTDPVGHASVVQRRLLHGGRALRAGYVEASACEATDVDVDTPT